MVQGPQLIVACVRVGAKYPLCYVRRLRNMVSRYLETPHLFICLTDRAASEHIDPGETCEATFFVDISDHRLEGWWAKMALFEPRWRGDAKVIFFDLDTVICGPIDRLAELVGELWILESPVRLAGNKTYPCRYNSSCMVIGPGMASFIWRNFEQRRDELMWRNVRHGDQKAIEEIYPQAPLLQRFLPGFFLNYRNLSNIKPKGVSVVNFGGDANRPHTCKIPWIVEAWR